MKTNRYLLGLALLVVGTMPAFSQVSNDNEDEVNKVDNRFAQSYVPGQVIVKFVDNSSVRARSRGDGSFSTSNINSVDKLLKEYGVEVMEKLYPAEEEKPSSRLRSRQAPNGTVVKERNLDKVFLLKMNEDSPIKELVKQLEAMPEVEYAEPNYYAYITADVPANYGASSYPLFQTTRSAPAIETNASVICSKPSNNPLYFRQYGITQQNIHKLWDKKIKNHKRPVIAILDTGVDITHPDLAENIWTNTAEAEGESAYDDDNNGIVDDKYGWNFVDDYGDLTDRNGHGTHVAGIAAAADNNIGIVGANPLALIMPVKVMSDKGVGDIATINRGILYAVENGADIINMSFGMSTSDGNVPSALKDVLDRAYQTTILVASAGNSGSDIYCYNPGRVWPAAYYLVLGVEASASNLQRATYSNYDPDGPIYCEDGVDRANYEVQVPGDKIYSTLPGGKYNQLSGTSMSAPLFAGAISALQMVKDYPSKDKLFGDLIHLHADFEKIYSDETPRTSKIDLVSLNVDDNVEGNSNIDGQVDIGETIKFTPVLRNTWADATDINIKLKVDDAYQQFVTIQNPEVAFGYSLSAYGRQTAQTPITVVFGDNIGDNTRIKFTLEVSFNESAESFSQVVYITVNNKNYLSGIIDKDMTLTSDKTWYWNRIYLAEGCTLTIEPGTIIVVNSDGQNSIINGNIICQGTPMKPIIFDYAGQSVGYAHFFHGEVKYCYFKNFFKSDRYPGTFLLDLKNGYSDKKNHVFSHCRFETLRFHWSAPEGDDNYSLTNCTVYNSLGLDFYSPHLDVLNSNIIGTNMYYDNREKLPNINNSNFLPPVGNDGNIILSFPIDELGTLLLPSNIYYGTSNESVLKKHSACYPDVGWGVIDYSNMQKVPFSEAHGIVWKVVVNGYDAQDEYDQLPPLGVGKHKFEVYFNRPMNKAKIPQISFGVREPYTQNIVDEDGSWNEEGTIYTVYKTINGKTMSDGINRIYVWGAEDNEFFEIPYEKTRFNVMINAAGSMATGFAGEAKMGRIELTWNNENNDFDDAMGFNIYRYSGSKLKTIPAHYDENNNWIEETQVPDTICINKEIVDIETTEYTDYDVIPGTTYYYMYKVLSTDLKEYDVSNVVAVTPLTSELGDANGSGDVDVADVITTVNYAAGMEPKPFIFEAADMNKDQMIDILDVVGIIQVIMHTAGAPVRAATNAEAVFSIDNGILYVDSPVELAGVQVQLATADNQKITVDDDLDGFEHTSAWLSDNDYLFMAYNMNGKILAAGKHALLHIGDAQIAGIRLADVAGRNITAISASGDSTTSIDRMGKDVINVKGVYNLSGQKLAGSVEQMKRMPKGVYIINGQKVVK